MAKDETIQAVIAEENRRQRKRHATAAAFARALKIPGAKRREARVLKRLQIKRKELVAASAEFARQTEIAARALKKRPARKAPPKPPLYAPLRRPIKKQRVVYPVCLFPADSCSSEPLPNSCDASKAFMKVWDHSSGVGGMLGLEASVATFPKTAASLWYELTPPIDGILSMNAFVAATGTVYVRANDNGILDRLLTAEGAEASVAIRITVHRGSFQQPSAPVFISSLKCSNAESDFAKFDSDLFIVPSWAAVVQGETVAIQVSTETYVHGRTDFAHAEVDFSTGAANITVLALCLSVEPLSVL